MIPPGSFPIHMAQANLAPAADEEGPGQCGTVVQEPEDEASLGGAVQIMVAFADG